VHGARLLLERAVERANVTTGEAARQAIEGRRQRIVEMAFTQEGDTK